MTRIKKTILLLLLLPILLFGVSFQYALASDNPAIISQLQAEIASLIKQIIAIMQKMAQQQTQTAVPAQTSTQTNNTIQTNNNNVQTNTQTQISGQTQNGSGKATLTVNVSGATAYVTINNGAQFTYTSPITLNNGDTYSVLVSNSSSTNRCNGTASSGGSYVCNVNLNSNY